MSRPASTRCRPISLPPVARLLLLGLVLLAASACTPFATVRHKTVDYRHGLSVHKVSRTQHGHPEGIVGYCLSEARAAAATLAQDPGNKQARDRYNFEVARVIEHLDKCRAKPWAKPLTVPGPDGDYTLSARLKGGADSDPANFRLIPADTLVIGGRYFKQRARVEGLGAPLVAIARNDRELKTQAFAQKQIYASVTAIIRFKGRQAEIEFIEPLVEDEVRLDGHVHTLAADLSAPSAVFMADERPETLGLARMLLPEKYADTARLTRMQPYDPERIPVVFVHGLQDTPASWAPMMNSLWADPEIRDRYQFWVYSYPSGYPYPYSASLMRRELDRVRAAFPQHKDMVLVGHSMGALLCRLMITDAGEKIWVGMFGGTPREEGLTGSSRNILEEALIFNHRHDVSRVVFIAAPHRGSEIASHWIGRLGSRLVKTPKLVASLRDTMFSLIAVDLARLKLDRMPNSIDTLSPSNRFVQEVSKLPMTPGIPYHSIIGDRGRGNTPNSSDGVVPYWSSHVDGAQSELIVPSGHSANRNPKGIAEVRRILLLHVGKQ